MLEATMTVDDAESTPFFNHNNIANPLPQSPRTPYSRFAMAPSERHEYELKDGTDSALEPNAKDSSILCRGISNDILSSF
jgi:hypothetical protein